MSFNIKDLFRKKAGDVDSASNEDSVKKPVVIDKLAVQKANVLFDKYKAGKARLEERIAENEQFWKLKQWDHIKKNTNPKDHPSNTADLWNCIATKHADFMDGYPTPNIVARSADDEAEAKKLSDIVPAVMEHAKFRKVYSKAVLEKLKQGCSITGVFWDPTLHNGLGDVTYKVIDPLMLFWEPGKEELQESANVFYCDLIDNDLLKSRYPELLNDKILSSAKSVTKYIYEDNVDTSNMSLVIDWYYKKQVGAVTVLHFAKFVGNTLLYSSENEGLPYHYAHGLYPFVTDCLYSTKGSWFGLGFIDIGKNEQKDIDLINHAVVKNTAWGARPRYFAKRISGINEQEFSDLSRDIVHFEGQVADIKPIEYNPIHGNYLSFLEGKRQQLKEVTGNRDVNSGGSTSGITAASAIAALQESGSKLSRDAIGCTYDAYEDIVYLTIELIREKYTVQREFRIRGADGSDTYTQYTNAGIKDKPQQTASGRDMGVRRVEFDIIVSAEKASPYKKIERNELMVQFYNMGLLFPQNAPAALQMLALMDFEGKERIIAEISKNGSLYDRLVQYQQIALEIAAKYEPLLAEELAEAIDAGMTIDPGTQSAGGNMSSSDTRLDRVRDEAQERTQPT